MIALTIRQPWAWAIMHAGKDVENRTSAVLAGHVGAPVAIHAGRVLDQDAYQHPLIKRAIADAWTASDPAHPWHRQQPGGPWQRAAFLGVIHLAGVHRAETAGDLATAPEHGIRPVRRVTPCCDSPWAASPHSTAGVRITPVHHVLACPRALPEPIPAGGRQGGFYVERLADGDLVDAALTALLTPAQEPPCDDHH